MVEKNKVNLIDLFTNFIPILLAFLMPVFFLPITSEFFELNKLALLTVSTVVMLILWMVKMITERKVFLTKSVLDLGILAFFAVVILSSLFSLHKVSSIFGSYGRWFPSLLGFSVLVGFYYALSANLTSIKTVKKMLVALLAGSTVSTIVALLSYFGIRLGSASYFQQPSFTLTGSTTTTALLAAIALLICLVQIINTNQIILKVVYLQAFFVNLLGVLLIGSLPVYIPLIIGTVAVFYFTTIDKLKANQSYLIGLAGIVAAIVAVFAVPTTRELLVNNAYSKEVLLSFTNSRLVSFSVLRDFPMLGSGPSTFYLNFPIYRPISMNAGNLWNVRFDKPYSEIFNVIASLGILGIMATLLLGAKVFKLVMSSKHAKEENDLTVLLSALLLMTTLFFVFSYASVLSMFLLFTFMALLVAVLAINNEKNYARNVTLTLASLSVSSESVSIIGDGDEKTEILPFIISLPLLALLAFGCYQFGRMYLGEYYMRSAVTASLNNNGGVTYDMQARAINVNPRRDNYHTAFAQTGIVLANSLAGKEGITDDEKLMVQRLIAQSIQSSQAVTDLLNPLSVSGWETRAFIYRSLIGAAQDADQWAIQSYNKAIQLDPTNPRLRLDLGGLYYAKGDYLNAANLFKQSVQLKQDYANARYNFAYSLIQLKAYPDAQRELEIVQRLVPQDSEDYKKVAEDINTVKQAIAQAGSGTTQTKPTVDQIQAQQINGNTQPTNQEPLAKPSTEENVNVSLPTPTPTPAVTPSN